MKQVRLLITYLIALLLIATPTLALTITLNYPPDYAQTIDTTPTFNFTPTGSSSSYNCTLYIDGTNYGEATNIPNNTAAEITPSSPLSLGDHNWNITCEGVGTTETGTSETRVIGIGENFSRCAIFIDPGTYKLTADIVNSSTSNCLNFQANDIVLDCQGHLVDGDDVADYGIYIYRSSAQTTNITIKNCRVSDWDMANIYLGYSENVLLDTVDIVSSSSSYGIYINYPVYDLKIQNASITAGYGIYSTSSGQMDKITIENATLTGYGSNYGIRLYNMNNVTINNTYVDNFYYGILISDYCNDIYIKNSYVESSATNIACESDLCYHNKNIVIDNVTTEGGSWGINIPGADSAYPVKNVTIMNCKIYNTSYAGIVLRHQENVTIKNNVLKGNAHSIRFTGTIKGNIYILNNYMNDTDNIYWSNPDCSGATFILNTTKQVGTNIISGGFLAGNFWGKSDNTGPSQTCDDSNIDGICDNSFIINSSCNIIDYMPLSTKYDPTPPEITFLTESRDYSPGTVSINLTAQDNVVGCSLNISGTIYDMNRNGNLFWLDYTLSGPVWVYAKCWDPADWRTNYTIKSLYLGVLTGGYGASGYTPSPTSPTYYPLSITVSSPTPVTILIYDTEGNLVKKVEYVTGFSVLHLPEGKYIIKSISDGREQTFELTIDGPKSIMISSQQGISMQIAMWILVIFTVVFFVLLKERRLKKEL